MSIAHNRAKMTKQTKYRKLSTEEKMYYKILQESAQTKINFMKKYIHKGLLQPKANKSNAKKEMV